ncbi:MAG: HU family DNA-binding protein [Candidatus Jettenia caeni]|nr:MAG: HU family DNA-binding protein [Candidatus Jettenia caeni]
MGKIKKAKSTGKKSMAKVRGKMTKLVKERKIHASEVAGQIASMHNITKKAAKGILLDIFTIIAQILVQGGVFSHTGFGSFKLTKIKAREVKTPKGQIVTVPTHNKVKFIPSVLLKKNVNA